MESQVWSSEANRGSMKHAPEAYLVEDGEAIARHMSGHGDRETAARDEASREEKQA